MFEFVSSTNNIINSMGKDVFIFNGEELPMQTGEIPTGYATKACYKVFSRNKHSKGYFSKGPEINMQSQGNFMCCIFMGATNLVAGSKAFRIEIIDNASSKILTNEIFLTSQLPPIQIFGLFTPQAISVKGGERISINIFAEGGCDLALYFMRIDRSLI